MPELPRRHGRCTLRERRRGRLVTELSCVGSGKEKAMSRRVSVFVLLAALALAGTMSGIAASHTFAAPRNATTSLAVPSVDPNYIYDQLAYMVTSFQRREAG